MKFTIGSPLTFTPDHGWTAYIKDGAEQYELPVIGWATAVSWTGFEGPDRESASQEVETDIEAVVLVDRRHALLLREHLRGDDNERRPEVQLIRTPDPA